MVRIRLAWLRSHIWSRLTLLRTVTMLGLMAPLIIGAPESANLAFPLVYVSYIFVCATDAFDAGAGVDLGDAAAFALIGNAGYAATLLAHPSSGVLTVIAVAYACLGLGAGSRWSFDGHLTRPELRNSLVDGLQAVVRNAVTFLAVYLLALLLLDVLLARRGALRVPSVERVSWPDVVGAIAVGGGGTLLGFLGGLLAGQHWLRPAQRALFHGHLLSIPERPTAGVAPYLRLLRWPAVAIWLIYGSLMLWFGGLYALLWRSGAGTYGPVGTSGVLHPSLSDFVQFSMMDTAALGYTIIAPLNATARVATWCGWAITSGYLLIAFAALTALLARRFGELARRQDWVRSGVEATPEARLDRPDRASECDPREDSSPAATSRIV